MTFLHALVLVLWDKDRLGWDHSRDQKDKGSIFTRVGDADRESYGVRASHGVGKESE